MVAAGVPLAEVSMLSNETIAAVPGASVDEYGPLGDAEVSGADLAPRLTRLGVEQSEAEGYAEGVRRGGGLVVVRTDDARGAQATEIMDRAGALDHEARVESWRTEGWVGYEPNAVLFTPAEADAERRRRAEGRSSEDAAIRVHGRPGARPLTSGQIDRCSLPRANSPRCGPPCRSRARARIAAAEPGTDRRAL